MVAQHTQHDVMEAFAPPRGIILMAGVLGVLDMAKMQTRTAARWCGPLENRCHVTYLPIPIQCLRPTTATAHGSVTHNPSFLIVLP